MKNAVHFVGFRGNEYISAMRVFGCPDFFHRIWDGRAKEEIFEGDVVVFARGDEKQPVQMYSFDDSNEF